MGKERRVILDEPSLFVFYYRPYELLPVITINLRDVRHTHVPERSSNCRGELSPRPAVTSRAHSRDCPLAQVLEA